MLLLAITVSRQSDFENAETNILFLTLIYYVYLVPKLNGTYQLGTIINSSSTYNIVLVGNIISIVACRPACAAALHLS